MTTIDIDLRNVRLDEEMIQAQREHLEKAIGFATFGERGIPRTATELAILIDAEKAEFLRFVDEFVRQYQVPAAYTLISVARQHLGKAMDDNDMTQLLMARNYSRSAFETINGLLNTLTQVQTPTPNLVHPTFRPTQAQLDHFVAVIFVMASTTNFLTEAIGIALSAAQEA